MGANDSEKPSNITSIGVHQEFGGYRKYSMHTQGSFIQPERIKVNNLCVNG